MKKFFIPIAYVAMLVTISCDNETEPEPDYPIKPEIRFEKLKFIEGANGLPDSLQFSIIFLDGDMDLGLSSQDISDPYHPYNYFLKDNAGNLTSVSTKTKYNDLPPFVFVKPGQTGKLVNYHNGENEIPYECPFRRTKYTLDSIFIDGSDASIFDESIHHVAAVHSRPGHPDIYVLLDTFYYEPNVNYNNIDVQFLIKNNDGSFTEYNWKDELCVQSDFSQRFPRIDELKTGTITRSGPFLIDRRATKKGIFTYTMASFWFKPVLSGRTTKLRITVRDRALHTSNTLETLEFIIQ